MPAHEPGRAESERALRALNADGLTLRPAAGDLRGFQRPAAGLGEHVPIGRRTLERRCRAALGRGIAEEIRRTRLERACRLLAGTDLPIKTVAAQSGFVDFRYLALVVRKELGMSPSAYRQQMRSPVSPRR